MENPNPASRHLSDYASSDEAKVAARALRKVRAGERDFYGRYSLNEALGEMRKGLVPWRWVYSAPPPPPLDEIMRRYSLARAEGEANWHRDVANTPIDDAAWEHELARRSEIDDYFARGSVR
jgi:hypothetical protein